MRSNVRNKIQLNSLVSPETKIQLQECAESFGIKSNEAMELAVARLYADRKNINASAKSPVKQLSEDISNLRKVVDQIDVKISCLYNEA